MTRSWEEALKDRSGSKDILRSHSHGATVVNCVPRPSDEGTSLSSAGTRADSIHAKSEQNFIGIDGKWYEVSNFIGRHPGGPIIEQFLGQDASAVFHAFHRQACTLKRRTSVSTYKQDFKDPATLAFQELGEYFNREGYFETSWRWYCLKFAIILALSTSVVYMVTYREEWYMHYAGALTLAAFWQQCGFVMHDAMHTQLTGNRRIDHLLGTISGTSCLGLSATWWRDEHFVHHALTNVVDYTQHFADPQMWEPSWAQNEKLFPYYKGVLHRLAVRFQHITFIPLCMFFGRVGIIVDSFLQERHWHEWLAFFVHWAWMSLLLSMLPSWREVFFFYSLASIGEGIMHIQLLISHYAKPFQVKSDMHQMDFYRFQVEANINIKNPWWLDWFHGGLNFHIEHHLFPRMPRHNFRRASEHIRRVCKEVNIEYDECSWTGAVKRTLIQLKNMSDHFSMDPR